MSEDYIQIEDVVRELKEAQDKKLYGDITFRLRAGNIIPIIDIKKTKKINRRTGGNNE